MRVIPLLVLLLAAPAFADAPKEPVLAAVDVFGSHALSSDDVIAVAGLTLGMPAGLDDAAFEKALTAASDRIEAKWQLAFVRVSPISYFGSSPDAGKTFVTIDLVDKGDEARMAFAKEPTGDVADPGGLVAAWIAYEQQAWKLVNDGELETGQCKGGLHCALGFGHDSLRGLEDQFIAGAPKHWRALRDVLRKDKNETRRAAAAFVLAYAGPVDRVVGALMPSIDDPDPGVRNNVVRVLLEIQQRAATPVLPLEPILRALRYPEVTDRNKAAFALEYLVAKDPAKFRKQVLAEDGDLLVAMTALSQPNNRDPAVAILTSLAGKDLGSPEAWKQWVAEQRAAKR
jgi:hypothetical protein